MPIIRDFNINFKREDVLSIVNSYYKINNINKANKAFDSMYKLLLEASSPIALYSIKDCSSPSLNNLKNCDNTIYCLITLGNEITKNIDDLLDGEMLLEGLILDNMASNFLFDITDQLYKRLVMEFKERDMGLTCKIAPGDGVIPIEYQKNIINSIDEAKIYGIKIEEGNVINPHKSMSYIYGAGKAIPIKYEEHICDICFSKGHCKMRGIKERVRKNFG